MNADARRCSVRLIGVNRRASAVRYPRRYEVARYVLLVRTKFTKWSNLLRAQEQCEFETTHEHSAATPQPKNLTVFYSSFVNQNGWLLGDAVDQEAWNQSGVSDCVRECA